MSRSTRVSILLAVAVGLVATGAWANVPSPNLSTVPDGLTLSPGTLHGSVGTYTAIIAGAAGPVDNATVIVTVAADVDPLVAWCLAQTGKHPAQMDATDVNGVVSFTWQGGGCVNPVDIDDPPLDAYTVQVTANGVIMAEPWISSPDVVNSSGKRVSELDPYAPIYAETSPGSGVYTTGTTLSDAVEHTAPIQLGQTEPCSKFTPGANGTFRDPVGLSDAVAITAYVQEGTSCTCEYP